MKRTITEELYVKIYVADYYVDGGMGFVGDWVDGVVYFNGPFTTEEDLAERVAKARAEWAEEYKERWGAPYNGVKVRKYWKRVK